MPLSEIILEQVKDCISRILTIAIKFKDVWPFEYERNTSCQVVLEFSFHKFMLNFVFSPPF